MTDWETYGQEVRALREARGWSQGKLGALANDISQAAVRDVEAGDYANGPHPNTIAGIQVAFGANPGEDGYNLTARYVDERRAEAIAKANDRNDPLMRVVGLVPADRREEIAGKIREFLELGH